MPKLIRAEPGHSPRMRGTNQGQGPSKGAKGSARTRDLAKARFLQLRRDGYPVADCLNQIGYTDRSYYNWREKDPEFKLEADRITGRLSRNRDKDRPELPDFETFCEEYLGWRMHWHQLQWIDLLEGREPRDLHPAEIYLPGRPTHVICNTPPEHSKTSSITVAYTVYSIIKDPNELIILVSKNQEMAADFLTQIKDFLTNPAYAKLQDDFGPEEGYEKACAEWSRNRIRFGTKLRDLSAKDPTVQAVGMRGQIYGRRATKIIIDDAIDTENVTDIDRQFNWITRMVSTRIGARGKLLVVGTRVAPIDLYKELRNPDRYAPGVDPAWTYFAQPAVLEFADDPEDWVTLWPRSNMPQVGDDSEPGPDGTYEMWSGPRLKARRDTVGEATWIQGYMQMDLQEHAVFPREDVNGCVNKDRRIGRMNPNLDQAAKGWPHHGDLYVLAGLDPASVGHTAMVCYGIDLRTGKRYVIDVHNQANMTPAQVRSKMVSWTDLYSIKEWRIESVLLSNWILQDATIMREMANRGAILAPHQTTGRTKWDPLAGVMGMAPLFANHETGENLIELPSPRFDEPVRVMIDQLITFFPETKAKTDILMALWFAETRARDLIRDYKEDAGGHVETWWDSDWHEASRLTVHLALDGQAQQDNDWWS